MQIRKFIIDNYYKNISYEIKPNTISKFEIAIDFSKNIEYKDDCLYINDNIIESKINYIIDNNLELKEKSISIIYIIAPCIIYDEIEYNIDEFISYEDFIIKKLLE